jgi:uncharacterized protein
MYAPLSTADALFAASAPRSAEAHLFGGRYVVLPNGSRIYDIEGDDFAALAAGIDSHDDDAVTALLARLGIDAPRYIDDVPPVVPVRALSLAVAQKCNLGCTYCYAQEGSFGAAPKNMPLDVALAAADLLLHDAAPGERMNLAFLGGEPLANRSVLRAATEHAAALARARGATLTFSITTNGTLLTPDDAAFFEEHAFAVTVSIDGVGAMHDALRPFKGGAGSYDRIVERVTPLLAMQRAMQVSARVTVTPRNLALPETLEELLRLGFHSVGFSPMLASPTGREEMARDDLARMLEGMVACGGMFEREITAGRRFAFANMVNAMRELHKGTHRPYPCGAGAAYLGVSASGELAACHRFVGDEAGAMGDLSSGVDENARAAWMASRHVHRQEPCRQCWARYLCGGGCHHEVIARGRPSCDYIRGWLHYCLEAYARLLDGRPDWFGEPS